MTHCLIECEVFLPCWLAPSLRRRMRMLSKKRHLHKNRKGTPRVQTTLEAQPCAPPRPAAAFGDQRRPAFFFTPLRYCGCYGYYSATGATCFHSTHIESPLMCVHPWKQPLLVHHKVERTPPRLQRNQA
ncbi:hypothetical protein V5799_008848 [Amblyomma americanum]|uniref:Uncharacterized protein n=1 Tax=Amblyomma americanum TaxID=6943 RepID=A0AAQ4FC30_AMBAM